MAAIGRFQEAADAYEHLAKLVPNDPDVLADYADALGMAQGRSLAGRPTELAQKALRIDPRHRKALALAGTAALDRGDFAAAASLLGALMAAAATGLAGSRSRCSRCSPRFASAPLPPASRCLRRPPDSPGPQPPVVACVLAGSPPASPRRRRRQRDRLRIDRPGDRAKQVTGTETLFVFARSEGGPRMPLAVMRTAAPRIAHGLLARRHAVDGARA